MAVKVKIAAAATARATIRFMGTPFCLAKPRWVVGRCLCPRHGNPSNLSMIEIRCNILPASGAKTYRLRLPPNAPVKNFWSMTIYDVNTRTLIQSSRIDLLKNADGSIDLHAGPTAPAGFEKNRGPSVLGRAWFLLFPALRADRSALRQDVGAAGLREGEVSDQFAPSNHRLNRRTR
jgi:hypothetical protein